MNMTSLFARALPKPSDSSATRKLERMRKKRLLKPRPRFCKVSISYNFQMPKRKCRNRLERTPYTHHGNALYLRDDLMFWSRGSFKSNDLRALVDKISAQDQEDYK